MQSILSQYERESSQAINCQKSGILFSRNINQGIQDKIVTILEVTNPLNTGRYLGLPSLVGRSKRQIFGFLRDKLRKRFQGWRPYKGSGVGYPFILYELVSLIRHPSGVASTNAKFLLVGMKS